MGLDRKKKEKKRGLSYGVQLLRSLNLIVFRGLEIISVSKQERLWWRLKGIELRRRKMHRSNYKLALFQKVAVV